MIRLLTAGVVFVVVVAKVIGASEAAMADAIKLKLRSIESNSTPALQPRRVTQDVEWDASQTAIIVCDVWDYHHCLNAVRRLEEFAPRLDLVLKGARQRGAIVIHAPSDCMPAYADHPARQRAMQIPKANPLPPGIELWCSSLAKELQQYPIDQSDGGEDDDPQEHAEWAAKLKAMARNPSMPWKKQSNLITIDSERDYISDRGDEVWSILEQRGIRNVILTGVHCNMCVLGRPFGLRQMVKNGKQVALMRDMTDSMYSPKSWPFVDHFTGHHLIIDYVEANICSTITSDQFLGGKPFRWKADQRDLPALPEVDIQQSVLDPVKQWVSGMNSAAFQKALKDNSGSVWYRGALFVPAQWSANGSPSLSLPAAGKFQVWLNGHELQASPPDSEVSKQVRFVLPLEHIVADDYNLLVVKAVQRSDLLQQENFANLTVGQRSWDIERGWQVRIGEYPHLSNIPLPAKFGIGPDAVLKFSSMMRVKF